MSIKKIMGMAGIDISDEEILTKMAQAHRLGKEFIEFVNGAKMIRIHVHECEPHRNFDSEDRNWLAS